MKGIIKLFPAALAVFALASCSNEDFFGSENASGKLQLEATVEAPNSDDGTTRAAFLFTANGNSSLWQSGDEFRVYDAALQKYDNFVCDGSVIAVDGEPVVAEHSKAIFPGNQVYYAGYDKDNDDVIAIMDVPDDIEFGGLDKAADGTAYYASDMPMWGDVTDATSSNLKVELKTLSAFTDITVYQKSVKYIRVLAAANAATVDASPVGTGVGAPTLATATIQQIIDNDILDAKTPLAGYFEAQLKTGGVLKANRDNPVVKNSYKSYVTVDLSQNAADEAHIYIPIIAGVKYTNLIIQTSADGTTWNTLKAYKGATFERNGALRKDLVRGKAPIAAEVSSLKDLNDKLATIASTTEYQGRTVNITATGDIKTTQALAKLTIPTMTADQIVNFNFPIDDTDNPLTITGGTADHTMTINLNQGISGNTAVNINTAGKLVLTGSITSSRSDEYKKLNVTAAQELTLGSSEDFKSFTSNMDIVSSASPLVIDAAEGTIDNVALSGTATLKVESGTVTTVNSASSGKITIDGGKVTTINKTATDGDVEINDGEVTTLEAKTAESEFETDINGGKVTDLKLAKSSGNVTIDDATVTTLETAATGADAVKITSTNADATVTTLKLNADAHVTLTGDTGDDAFTAKIGTLNANSKVATVSSTGKAVISTASNLKDGSSFTSGWNDTKIATSDITGGNIYTAAQLAGIKANTAYTLKTTITSTANWTPVNLSGNFTADKLTVTVKGAPLFNKISGTAVIGGKDKDNVMTLETGDITGAKDENNLGSLAKEVEGTVTVKFVKANADGVTIQGNDTQNKAENIGGLIGKASGAVTLQDIQLGGTSALTLKGHANVGGYIGNVAGANSVIKILSSQDYASKFAFAKQGDYTTAPDKKAGTFGNFIGSITGTNVAVTIGKAADDKGGSFDKFIAASAYDTAALGFEKNTITVNSATKTFKGMTGTVKGHVLGYEIGYSTGTIKAEGIALYDKVKIKNNLGIDQEALTIDDINQYND